MFKVPEQMRHTEGRFATTKEAGNNGIFFLPLKRYKALGIQVRFVGYLQCIASDGLGWEHVSVCVVHPDKKTLYERTPTWEEMCMVKNHFWDKNDIAIQFHPNEDNYVNNHPYVLHLWKKIGSIYELPIRAMV